MAGLTSVEAIRAIDQESRRTGNYKPNIWKYDHLETLLPTEYDDEKYKRCSGKSIEDIRGLFFETKNMLDTLELIDNIEKLGLGYLFEQEIKDTLDTVASSGNPSMEKDDLYATALCFTLLREHGYRVSQDMFIGFLDETQKLKESIHSNVKAMLRLFEASHLSFEDENILQEVQMIAERNLKLISPNLGDTSLALKVSNALELPMNYRVEWYDVKRQIYVHEKETNRNSLLLNLAKLNFNMVQATHQKELREIYRWWMKQGIAESVTFTRNRIVESHLWAVGTVFEPQYGSFRKWTAKALNLVIVLDDVYDVYGTLQELEHFTSAVERWDSEGTKNLPECMKTCFQTLFDTINETASEMQKEMGWNSVSPSLHETWADFCKALLAEAKWYNKNYTPSPQEYLDNGWISSSGPVLSLHLFFSATDGAAERAMELLKSTHDITHSASLIFRLCNDLQTSKVEQERGDAPSSIQCLMHEKNVSEEVARKEITSIITSTWKQINKECIELLTQSPVLQRYVKYVKNITRVVQMVYRNGDGIAVHDGETRDQVLSLLIEPVIVD